MIGLLSLVLLPKAALEAWYFQDRSSAKLTLFSWFLSTCSVLAAFMLSLLFDYLGQAFIYLSKLLLVITAVEVNYSGIRAYIKKEEMRD